MPGLRIQLEGSDPADLSRVRAGTGAYRGVARVRIGWLLAALAPGFFSGIAAVFLLVPIVGRLAFGDGQMSATLNVLDLFGWCSGVFALAIAVKRHRFLAHSKALQRRMAIAIWLVHFVALVLLILYGPAYA